MAGLEEELVKLINEGYTLTKILKIYGKEFEDKYQISEDHMYTITREFIKKFEKNLSFDEMQRLSQKRKLLSEKLDLLKKNEIVELVREFVCAELSNAPKDIILNNAITRAAKIRGIGKETVKKYMKEYDSEFYAEYSAGDVEYYIELATKIIENNIPSVFAKQYPGYTAMIRYVEVNQPDLYELIKENFVRHSEAGKTAFRDTDKPFPSGRK